MQVRFLISFSKLAYRHFLNDFFLRWVGGDITMIFTGFVMYFVGCSTIYLVMFMSIER